ncbi:MAG TPA: hypothetical protein VN581_00835 [Patescibacteria group bacterium]|nr:hypothetical protein [Patescibacteria group bacterium]
MKIATILTLLLASGSLFAKQIENEAFLTEERAARGDISLVGLDFASDGKVSAFQMRVDLPEDASRIDLKSCLSNLPKNFTGICKAYGTRVSVTVYSPSLATLPEGLNSVGMVKYRSGSAAGAKLTKISATQNDGVSAKIAGPIAAGSK